MLELVRKLGGVIKLNNIRRLKWEGSILQKHLQKNI